MDIIEYQENGMIAIVSTDKKSEDGLMWMNPRPFYKKFFFKEPEIIQLRYIKPKKRRPHNEKL